MTVFATAQWASVAVALLGVALCVDLYVACTGRAEYHARMVRLVLGELRRRYGSDLTWKDELGGLARRVVRMLPLSFGDSLRQAFGEDDYVTWRRSLQKMDRDLPATDFFADTYATTRRIANRHSDVGDPAHIAGSEYLAGQRELCRADASVTDQDYLVLLREKAKKPSLATWWKTLKAYPDERPKAVQLLLPWGAKFLDYVGRGTAGGLIVGLLLDGGQWAGGPDKWATLLPVVGGLLGGLLHGMSMTVAMLPEERVGFRQQHPCWTYLITVALLIAGELAVVAALQWMISASG